MNDITNDTITADPNLRPERFEGQFVIGRPGAAYTHMLLDYVNPVWSTQLAKEYRSIIEASPAFNDMRARLAEQAALSDVAHTLTDRVESCMRCLLKIVEARIGGNIVTVDKYAEVLSSVCEAESALRLAAYDAEVAEKGCLR
jgi:hypothetical protein